MVDTTPGSNFQNRDFSFGYLHDFYDNSFPIGYTDQDSVQQNITWDFPGCPAGVPLIQPAQFDNLWPQPLEGFGIGFNSSSLATPSAPNLSSGLLQFGLELPAVDKLLDSTPSPPTSLQTSGINTPKTCEDDVSTNVFIPRLKHPNLVLPPRSRPKTKYPCATASEPGCAASFSDLRSRGRHRAETCHHTPPLKSSFRCRCGTVVKRWYRFDSHHKKCTAGHLTGGDYGCECGSTFTELPVIRDHYKREHMGRAGRPKGSSKKQKVK